jgi:tetratricopeptide (TPR) repeat protein
MASPKPHEPPKVTRLLQAAIQFLRAGQPGEATAPLRAASRLAPKRADIAHDLGVACLASGKPAEAIEALKKAIALDPAYADAYLRLGIAFEAMSRFDASLEAYRQAAARLPSLADAHYREGDLLESLGRNAAAACAYRQAAAISPASMLGLIGTAKALLLDHREAEAERTLRTALLVEPGNAVALELLGTVLANVGRFDEAQTVLLHAAERSPLQAGSYYEVARCRRFTSADAPLIARMQATARLPTLQPGPRSKVHLALGKACEDLGDYEAAMRHFDEAETLRNTISSFDVARFEAQVEQTIQDLSSARIAETARAENGDPLPILIVGLPRSGTTLVEQILSAHPDVHAAGELPFWIERGYAWSGLSAQLESEAAQAAYLDAAAADYLSLLRGLGGGAGRVTDKMPLNFLWAGLIHMALPRATIIHCQRSAIDTALSIHQTHFNARMPFPTGGPLLLAYIRGYRRLTAHWRRVLPADRFVEIRYEDLVRDADPVIRRMVAACGLPWDDACLRPEKNDRTVDTPSKWQVRQAIFPTAVGRWRRYERWLGALSELIDEAEPDQRQD